MNVDSSWKTHKKVWTIVASGERMGNVGERERDYFLFSSFASYECWNVLNFNLSFIYK